MTRKEIIEKIKLAEEITQSSMKFPKETYQVVLNHFLSKGNYSVDSYKIKNKGRSNMANNNKKTNKGLAQKLNDLISDGFFDTIKTNREIITKLKLMGFQMKDTSLPSYLIPKVRNQELIREEVNTKNGKIYGYIRKNK